MVNAEVGVGAEVIRDVGIAVGKMVGVGPDV